MASPGGSPYSDVTGRMEMFGRIFGEQAGVPDVESVASTEALVAVVKARIPRSGTAKNEAPVFEAAAYIGEWLRRRARATWVAEAAFEPHLQLTDKTHAIVYLLPLVQHLRTASTAGYDGMARMLDHVLDDVSQPAAPAPLASLRVEPAEDRAAVHAWTRANRSVRLATRAALWRRCSLCSRIDEHGLTLHRPREDWESEAATAASILASAPFECPCGGPPGAVTRFLMVRHDGRATRLGDIYVANTFTRVGCWTLVEPERIEPFDALALAAEEGTRG